MSGACDTLRRSQTENTRGKDVNNPDAGQPAQPRILKFAMSLCYNTSPERPEYSLARMLTLASLHPEVTISQLGDRN